MTSDPANISAASTSPTNEREHAVFKMVLQGLSREQILAWIHSDKNKSGLQESDLDALLSAARKRMADLSHFQHHTELGKSLARLDDLYAKSFAIQDYKTCHSIERERMKLLTANRPAAESPASAPETSEAWVPLGVAATQLGFKAARALQLWCAGKDAAHQPPIPHKQKGRAFLIQIEPARQHLLKHASRLPPGFPRQVAAQTSASRSIQESGDIETDALTSLRSTRELLQQLLRNPEVLESASPQMLTALAGVDNALLRRQIAEEKARGQVPKEDVRRMLQAIGQVYVEKITDVLAPMAAKSCIRMVLEHHNIDLKTLNSDTQRFFEAEFRAAGQTAIEAVQREVDEQCAGLARLDLDTTPDTKPEGNEP